METIEFNGVQYPVRQITLSDGEEVTVSVEALNDELMDDNGHWVSHEAEIIDNDIFYFCDETDFNTLDDNALSAKIEDSI